MIFAELPLSHPVTSLMLVPYLQVGQRSLGYMVGGEGGKACVPVPKEVIILQLITSRRNPTVRHISSGCVCRSHRCHCCKPYIGGSKRIKDYKKCNYTF